MESFSLLKYWRGGGAGAGGGLFAETSAAKLHSVAESSGTTTIVTSVTQDSPDTDVDDKGDGDDGPFFDLEFAVPVEDTSGQNEDVSEDEKEEEEGESKKGGDSDSTDGGDGDFNFTLSSGSSSDKADPDLQLSPSDDLFFKGRLVSIEPPLPTGGEPNSSVKPSSAAAAQFSASFLKSATKFRVFMLGLKKSKQIQAKNDKLESNNADGDKPTNQNLFTVKFKVEAVPIVSMFTRDNSSRNSSSSSASKKQNGEDAAVSEEKRFVMMQKYLKKVKPLYFRVSKKYGEKLKLSGQLSFGPAPSSVKQAAEAGEAPEPAPAKSKKQGNLKINIPERLKVVRKHLGKSRSPSSSTPPAAAAAAAVAPPSSSRRDDSLLEQQDGIQGAILHCKRSFNSPRDTEPSVLFRSVSDPSYDKLMDASIKLSV